MRRSLDTRATGLRAMVAVVLVGLTGMAYCHIKDVGMKFDEHVYYMAYLFCANIAASIALAGAILASYAAGPLTWFRRALAVSVCLAAATIAGFLWSRTIGFPQMADHIGQWDTLGLASLAFEGTVVITGAVLLLRFGTEARSGPRADPTRVYASRAGS